MLKATFLKEQISHRGAVQRVYRLEPGGPLPEFVCVSAIVAMFSGPETYVFACDAEGEITDFSDLEGSYRGGLDHDEALRGAGYEAC